MLVGGAVKDLEGGAAESGLHTGDTVLLESKVQDVVRALANFETVPGDVQKIIPQ
jgi:hypothetical protein